MKNFASIIYAICVIVICALVIAGGIMLFKNFGENLIGDSSSSSISNSGTQNSGKTSSNNSSSGSQTGSQSSSSGGSQTPSPNYSLQEFSFDLANGYNPMANYNNGLYTIVIPLNEFSADLPDEGYKTYTVSEGEDVNDYLGDVAPLLYYEIKYEYGWEYYTKIILIPKSAFTITGGQLFVTNAIPDTVFNENFYESVYSDGAFISIKIISRDMTFSISDRWNTSS